MANMSDIKREEYKKKNDENKAKVEKLNKANAVYNKTKQNTKSKPKKENKKTTKMPVQIVDNKYRLDKNKKQEIPKPALMSDIKRGEYAWLDGRNRIKKENEKERSENKRLLDSGMEREKQFKAEAEAVLNWRNSFGVEYDLKYQEGKKYKDFLEGKIFLSEWEQKKLKPSYDWFEANVGFLQHDKDEKHIERYFKAVAANDERRKREDDYRLAETGFRVNLDENGEVDYKAGKEESKFLKDRAAFNQVVGNVSPAERQRVAGGEGTEDENRRVERWNDYVDVYNLEDSKAEAYDYYGENYDNVYSNDLGGRVSGNYKLGRIGTKTNDAGFVAYTVGTDDLEAVEVYQLLSGKIQQNNMDTFINNSGFDEWVATTAQYAPQAVDQLKAAIPGMVIKVAGGGPIGNVVSNAGQAGYMLRQTTGSAFIRHIQENGLLVSDAKKLAHNEGLVSGVMEFAVGSVFDGVGSKVAGSSVSTKVQKGLFKGLTTAGVSENGAKIIINSAKNAGKFVYNSIGEGTEEWIQEGVSITADKMAREGKAPGLLELTYNAFNLGNYSDEELDRMNDAAKGSFLIGIGRAGISSIGNISTSGVNRVMNSMENRNVGSVVLSMDNSEDIVFSAIDFGKQSENEGTVKAADYLDSVYLSGKTPSNAKVGGFLKQVAHEGHDVFGISGSDMKYSINTDFVSNYDKWVSDGRPDRGTITVGTTSGALQSIGVKDQRITWDTTKINKSLKKHTYLDDNIMKQIPDILERPIIVMQSKQSDSRLTMFGEVYDKDGLPVMAVLELLPLKDKSGIVLDEIKVVSTHSRKTKDVSDISQTQNLINSSDILYIEPNKNRTDSWFTRTKLQLPFGVTNYGSIKSVTYPGEDVNTFLGNSKKDLSQNAANVFNFRVAIEDTIQITDDNGNIVGVADGYYKNGVLHLSRNAKKPLDFVLSHELVHHLQRMNKKDYNAFRMLALRYISQQSGKSIDTLIAEKQNTYKSVGLSRNEAIDEIAADFAGEHLSGDKLQDLIQRIENGELIQNIEQGRNIIQKFIDAIRDLIQRIKMKYSSGKYFDKAVELRDVVRAYEKTAVGAVRNKDKLKGEKTVYSLRDDDSVARSFGIQKLGDYIHVQRMVMQTLKEESFFTDENSVSRKVVNKDSGMVIEITPKGIKETFGEKNYIRLSRGLKNAKLSTVRELPMLIENGIIIEDNVANEHNKNSGLKYAYIKSDAVVGDIPVSVKIAIRKSPQKNQFWVHQIDIIKKSDEDIPAGAISSKTGVQSLITDDSISQDESNVKYLISDENGIDSDIAPLFDESMSESDKNAEFETDDPEGLKETIRYLRARSEYLKGKKVSPSTVLAFAKELKKTYGSNISSRDLAVDIMKLFNEVAEFQISDDSDGTAFYNHAREIAKKILNSMEDSKTEISPEVKMMRNHIRSTGIKLSEQDKGDFGGKAEWNGFRKANMGRIKISNKGVSVDTFYKELCELYPEYFNEEQYTHPADQLRHIAKVLDDTDGVLMTDMGEVDFDSAEILLATEILEKFSTASASEKSVISEIEKIDWETKKEYEAKRNEDKESLKEWFRERYAKVQEARKIERYRTKTDAQEKINKIRSERRVADEKKKLLKLLQFFDKLRTTPERLEDIKNKMNEEELESFKDVEEFAGKTPEEIVRMLDSWGIRLMEEGYERTDGVKVMGRLELSELEAEYEKAKEADPDFLPNRILEKKFKRLRDIQIDTLTDQQVRELIELLAGVKTQIENENKLLTEEEEKRIDEVTKKVHKELKDGKAFMDSDMGFGGVTDKSIIKKWKIWQLNAMTVFKKLAGYLPNSEVYGIANILQDGQKRKTSFERAATRHFEKFFDENPKMRRTVKSVKKDEWIEVKDGWSISPGMRIALYLHSKNASNMESIRDFGITLPKESVYKDGHKKDAYNQGYTIKLSAKDVREIVKGMTKEERDFADNYAYTFFNGVTTKHINEVSRKLLGYDVAVVKNYFPKNSDMNMVETENVGVYDMLGTVEGQGFLKHRTGGKPVLLLDVFDVIDRTTAGVSKYYGMGLAMRDVRKILGKSADGGKTTLGLIAELHGEDMKRWVEDLLRDYENPKVDQQPAKERARGLRNKFASSVLVGRVSTLLKQGGAFFTGLPEVGMKNWSKSMSRHVTKKDIELWQDASTTFWQRGTDLRKIDPRAWIENVDKFWVQRLCSGIMVGIERDFNIKRNTKSDAYWDALRQPEVMEEIGRRIDDMINNTQSVYSTMERPTVLREDKAFLKHLLPFRTQNFQDFNMLTQNIQEFRALAKYAKQEKATKEQVLAARRKCLNTVLGLSLNYVYGSVAMLLSAVILGQNLDDRYEEEGEDEEEEKRMYDELSPFWQGVNDIFNKDGKGVITPDSVFERMTMDTINGFAGDFMFCDEVVNFAQSTMTGKKYYGLELSTLEMINDTLAQLGRTVSSIKEIGSDKFSLKGLLTDVKDLAIQTGGLFAGVPGKNIEDVFIAALFHCANAIEQTNNKYDVSFYFNPYKVRYALLKYTTNIKSDQDWYIEQFYDMARFAVNIKNPQNRQKAYDDLNTMFWEASEKFTNDKDRAKFQEKVYKELERLGYRNSNVMKRVLSDKETWIDAGIVDYSSVDNEIQRLNVNGADIDFKPDKRAVLTYTVTDENGNEIEKSVTLSPTESIRYAEDVKQMIYAAFNDAMNDSTWRIRTDEERVDIFNSYKKDAIDMVKRAYIRNKTGETIASTPFEMFEEEREHRKDEQSLYKVPGNKYVYLDGDTSVYYELPDDLAKEYDAAYNRNLKEIGEAIFTDKADISLYISGTYKKELYYSDMTDKQRKNTITSIKSTATKNKLSEKEKQQLISDFKNNKIPYEKQVSWGGTVDDLSVSDKDKLYDKIKKAAKEETEAELGDKIKSNAKVVYTKNPDLTWAADINDESVRAEQESAEKEVPQEKPVEVPKTDTPPKKVPYKPRAYKSSSNNAYNSKVQNYNYSNKNPFPVKTENGVKSVKVGNNFYSRNDINVFDIGYKYRRITKAPQDFKDLTYESWRAVMDTWIRCLAEWKFTDADRKTLQMEGSGLDAVFYEPESVAAAFWEWVQYGENHGFDTSEYLEIEETQETNV